MNFIFEYLAVIFLLFLAALQSISIQSTDNPYEEHIFVTVG